MKVYFNDSSEWIMVDSGLTTDGMVDPPSNGWNTAKRRQTQMEQVNISTNC